MQQMFQLVLYKLCAMQIGILRFARKYYLKLIGGNFIPGALKLKIKFLCVIKLKLCHFMRFGLKKTMLKAI